MKERMLAGKLYIPEGADIISDYKRAKRLTRLINSCTEEEEWKKEGITVEKISDNVSDRSNGND